MTGTIVFIFRILMALALYGLIIFIFLTIYRQYKAQLQLLSPVSNASLQLTNLDTPEKESLLIQQSEVMIGRDPNCKIHLPNETVSAQHARINLLDNQWWITDLNSTNGTFLNDELITHPCVITENDTIRFGQVKFLIHIQKKISES